MCKNSLYQRIVQRTSGGRQHGKGRIDLAQGESAVPYGPKLVDRIVGIAGAVAPAAPLVEPGWSNVLPTVARAPIEPGCPNVIPSFSTPLFEIAGKHQAIQLVDENVFVLHERLVELLREKQSIV